MSKSRKRRISYGYWTPATVGKVALKYKFRGDFQQGDRTAYMAAWRGGYLDQVCAHMGLRGHKYERGLYVYEFGGWAVYVGLTHDFDERHRAHMTKGATFRNLLIQELLATEPYRYRKTKQFYSNKIAGRAEERLRQGYVNAGWLVLNAVKGGGLGSDFAKWPDEAIRAEALRYDQRHVFKAEAYGAYQAAQSRGILNDVCAHMTTKIVRRGRWQEKSEVHAEALKYTCITDFKNGSASAYNSAYQNGWLDEVCSHFTPKHKPKGMFNDKAIVQSEALQYLTRMDFRYGSPSAYGSAVRHGWLDEVCSHMPKVAPRRIQGVTEGSGAPQSR